MNTKTILIWIGVFAVTGLIIFGMVKYTQSPASSGVLSQPVNALDWVKGDINSKVSLVEYGDFQCPACSSFYPVVADLIAKHGNGFVFSYRHFPLNQIHPNADVSARASEAAGKQGRFWEMYDLLFQKQAEWSEKSAGEARSIFTAYAGSLGLDLNKFNQDLDSSEVKSGVNADVSSGNASGVNSTPTLYLNGIQMRFSTLDQFYNQVVQAIENSK